MTANFQVIPAFQESFCSEKYTFLGKKISEFIIDLKHGMVWKLNVF